MFTGSELNKTLIRYLEHHLTVRARAAKRYTILTKNTYGDSVIKRHEKEAMEEFIDNIQILLSALNYRILEATPMIASSEKGKDGPMEELFFKMRPAEGRGVMTEDKQFLLFAGSHVNSVQLKSCPVGVSKRRASAVASGEIEDWVTKVDIMFKSTSAAASFLNGYATSGPYAWKDSDGKSLFEKQKEAE